MKYYLSTFGLFIFAAACTTPTEKLTQDADQVVVIRNPSIGEMANLRKIGSGSCEMGANVHTATTNQESCENYLRNEAGKKHADYIVFVSSATKGISSAEVQADFYKKK